MDRYVIAPLKDAEREPAAWLCDDTARRAVVLGRGVTLLANELRLREHAFPGRWFEASSMVIEVTDNIARVADAMSTNGTLLNEVILPRSTWRDGFDPSVLLSGDARARVAWLEPAWQPLRDGDALRTQFPSTTWRFTRFSMR